MKGEVGTGSHISVCRVLDDSRVYCAKKQIVVVDEAEVSGIHMGQVLLIALSPGRHTITVKDTHRSPLAPELDLLVHPDAHVYLVLRETKLQKVDKEHWDKITAQNKKDRDEFISNMALLTAPILLPVIMLAACLGGVQ